VEWMTLPRFDALYAAQQELLRRLAAEKPSEPASPPQRRFLDCPPPQDRVGRRRTLQGGS